RLRRKGRSRRRSGYLHDQVLPPRQTAGAWPDSHAEKKFAVPTAGILCAFYRLRGLSVAAHRLCAAAAVQTRTGQPAFSEIGIWKFQDAPDSSMFAATAFPQPGNIYLFKPALDDKAG